MPSSYIVNNFKISKFFRMLCFDFLCCFDLILIVLIAFYKPFIFINTLRYSNALNFSISAKGNSVKEIRELTKSENGISELKESLAAPVDLLKSQMLRLSLKQQPFRTFDPASKEDIDMLWEKCLEIDPNLKVSVNF